MFNCGRYSLITLCAPGFCKPIEFNKPLGDSITRSGLLPNLGSKVVPFKNIAPTSELEKPETDWYSMPYPALPEAIATGELKWIPQRFNDKSVTLINLKN